MAHADDADYSTYSHNYEDTQDVGILEQTNNRQGQHVCRGRGSHLEGCYSQGSSDAWQQYQIINVKLNIYINACLSLF